MSDPTFYIVGAYGATAIAIALELILLFGHRRRALRNAQAQAGLHRANQV